MDERKAIICVDDEAIILMALKVELRHKLKDRFRVETAINAQEAIDLVEKLYAENMQVILILSDWLMPGIKGDELITIVKSRHPDIHCVLVSGQADARTLAQARLDTILDAFIEKPWQASQLMEVVLRCIESGEGSLVAAK